MYMFIKIILQNTHAKHYSIIKPFLLMIGLMTCAPVIWIHEFKISCTSLHPKVSHRAGHYLLPSSDTLDFEGRSHRLAKRGQRVVCYEGRTGHVS